MDFQQRMIYTLAGGFAALAVLCFFAAWLSVNAFLANTAIQNDVLSNAPLPQDKIVYEDPVSTDFETLNRLFEDPRQVVHDETYGEIGVVIAQTPIRRISPSAVAEDTLPPLAQENVSVTAYRQVGGDALAQPQDLPRHIRFGHGAAYRDITGPKIVIVMDDLGLTPEWDEKLLDKLPKELTYSLLPYGDHTQKLAAAAYERGHDIMVHLPMEPARHNDGYQANPGPNALLTTHTAEEITALTAQNVAALSNWAVGVNNHMGSAFTAWESGLKVVFEYLVQERFFFLDSITSGDTKGETVAANFNNLLFIKRHLFLDHVKEEDKITAMLERLESIARSNGVAIGIGHPYPQTFAALEKWLTTLPEKGISLVPVSAILPE